MNATATRRQTRRNGQKSEDRAGFEPGYEVQGDGTLTSSAAAAANEPKAAAQPAGAGGGRDGRGRFTAANLGGPGNPFARQVAQLRSALIQRVTLEDINIIADELILHARNGRLEAIKLLFQYVIGKPTVAVNPDTLDVEEFQQIYAPRKEIWELASESVQCVPPRQCSAFMDVGNEAARMAMVDVLRGTDTAEPKAAAGAVNRQDAKDAKNDERAESVSQAPLAKGSNGAALREENGRPPSTNRTGGDEVKRPSTNGNGRNGAKQRGHGSAGSRPVPGGGRSPSTNGERDKPPNETSAREPF